jgi:hypothetical protein
MGSEAAATPPMAEVPMVEVETIPKKRGISAALRSIAELALGGPLPAGTIASSRGLADRRPAVRRDCLQVVEAHVLR